MDLARLSNSFGRTPRLRGFSHTAAPDDYEPFQVRDEPVAATPSTCALMSSEGLPIRRYSATTLVLTSTTAEESAISS